MNPKTFFTDLLAELKTIVWPTTANKVFGDSVYFVPEIPIMNIGKFQSPSCFISDTGSRTYPYHDELIEQEFTLSIFVQNVGDFTGEKVMLSGNRTANTSRGAGILDIEEVLLDHIRAMTVVGANKITLKEKSKVKVATAKNNEPSVFRTIVFSIDLDRSTDPDPDEMMRVPGFLYWKPTDLSDDPAGFGTKLGYARAGVVFDPNIELIELTEEDRGSEPRFMVYTGTTPKLSAVLLNYNNTAIARFFPGLTSADKVNFPGAVLSGKDLAADNAIADYLLFVPDDRNNHNVLLLQKAVPVLIRAIKLARDEDTAFETVFTGIRKTDDADGTFYMGPLAGATLR